MVKVVDQLCLPFLGARYYDVDQSRNPLFFIKTWPIKSRVSRVLTRDGTKITILTEDASELLIDVLILQPASGNAFPRAGRKAVVEIYMVLRRKIFATE
jgi:hypothetical protein